MKNTLNAGSLFEITETFPDDKSCRNYLEEIRWNGNITCPHCDSSEKIYKFSDEKRYKCGECKKQFTITVGTIFQGSKIPLKKWFWAIFLFSSHKEGISSVQLAKDIKIQQRSAWFMLQRIRYMMENKEFWKPMENTVELDESLLGGKEKNKHKKIKGAQGRSTKTKTPVLGILERNGNVYAIPVADTKAETIIPIIEDRVKKGASVFTDEWKSYRILGANYDHQFVQHSADQYVDGVVHTNNMENFWSLFKRGLLGIYHHVSDEHLVRYVNEFTFRYNNCKLTDGSKFDVCIANANNKRLTYERLRYEGQKNKEEA